jgi:predicted NodU family carbamoyl transferase
MKVLGISPLDKDANASLVVDGTVVFASGEERYSPPSSTRVSGARDRRGAPSSAGLKPEQLDVPPPF